MFVLGLPFESLLLLACAAATKLSLLGHTARCSARLRGHAQSDAAAAM
jgi:hypothetical protein